MKKDAWVLRLKEKVSSEVLDGKPYYFCDEESMEFLTDDLQEALIIENKEEYIEESKVHEAYMIDKFGDKAVLNFGWTNINKCFDFVAVEVSEQ